MGEFAMREERDCWLQARIQNSQKLIYIKRYLMLTIHSPKFSVGKTELTKNSPSFRHKRTPSATDNYTVQSYPKATVDSPAKLSEGRKRRSHHQPNAIPKHTSKEKGTRQIIDSIQNLKQEYKNLKEAYRELIDQKLKNANEFTRLKTENSQLLQENERVLRENERLKVQINVLQQEHDRTRRQCLKMLEVEKFKTQKLEESLVQKEEYINQTLMKIRTEGDETALLGHQRHCSLGQSVQEDISLTVSQDKSALDCNLNNQSQFLSFSLTSVLEESTDKDLLQSKRKKEHAKAASDLAPLQQCQEKKVRELPSFRKNKKEIPRIQLTTAQSKSNLIPHAVPIRGAQDKKCSRGKTSKSFREKENRQTLNHHNKKKSKKLINISGVSDL